MLSHAHSNRFQIVINEESSIFKDCFEATDQIRLVLSIFYRFKTAMTIAYQRQFAPFRLFHRIIDWRLPHLDLRVVDYGKGNFESEFERVAIVLL